MTTENWGDRFVRKAKSSRPLGSGSEKRVYPHPDPERDDQVVAIPHPEGRVVHYEPGTFGAFPIFKSHPEMDDAEQARYKRQFYLIKILNLLFPNNIPDVHLVTTEPRMMIREKVDVRETEPVHFNDPNFKLNLKQRIWDKPRLVGELRSLGLRIDDRNNQNYLPTKSGHVSYPDTFFIHASRRDFDAEIASEEEVQEVATRLEKAIRKKLREGDQKQALDHLARYRTLSVKKEPE